MPIYTQQTYLVAALICACIAAIYDLRSRRIPNRLTGPAILCGLALHLCVGGPGQAGLALLAGAVAGGVFLLFFVAGGMGAGDVKLMAAVGCLSGTAYLREVLVSTVFVGALISIVMALHRGRLRETVSNVVTLVWHHSAKGLTAHPELNVENPQTLRLPYAVPIAAGCLLTLGFACAKEWMS